MFGSDYSKRLSVVAALIVVAGTPRTATAEDWPTFRHDASRSAITAEVLAPPLHPQWIFVPPYPPEPAWPEPGKEKARARFDEVYHVAAAGDAVYFGSSADGKVYCLDAATGKLRWTALTGGPVRVAPMVAEGRVYIGSDDGCAYCFQAADGALIWKVRAGHREEKVLGNGEMISLWPIRTGVLVEDGVAYFAAGVFPSESLFLYAVNAADGTVLWLNDSFGEEGYKLEFGGISPQGPLLSSKTTLFVPSGRAMPGAFNKSTGEFLSFLSPGGKVGGTWALVTGDRLIAGTGEKRAYDTERGRPVREAAYAWFPGWHLVVAEQYAYMLTFDELVALDRKAFTFAEQWRGQVDAERRPLEEKRKRLDAERRRVTGEKSAEIERQLADLDRQIADLTQEQKRIEGAVRRWARPCTYSDALILAGDCLYTGGAGMVAAAAALTGEETWKTPVEGRACGLAVANGRLFASTDTGRIYCFGKEQNPVQEVRVAVNPAPWAEDGQNEYFAQAVSQIVAASGIKNGHALVYGNGTGRLAYELAKQTDLKIIAVDSDPEKVAAARKALDAAGLAGHRVWIEQGDLAALPYADYFANLIVSETILTTGQPIGSPDELRRLLKPCGGVLCLGGAAPGAQAADLTALRAWLSASDDFTVAAADTAGAWLTVTRGRLPNAGKWTHQYADLGNTACSDDERVRGPLGVLWFGEPGPSAMVERHARAAAPLAMDGRLFVQGENLIMAYDAYNGALLWKREIPGAVRVRVDSDMSNLALTGKALYVAANDQCFRLNPASGEIVRAYALPSAEGDSLKRWGYLACTDDTVFGSIAQALPQGYAEAWESLLSEDGTWAEMPTETEDQVMPAEYRRYLREFQAAFPKPDIRAFWQAQQSGFLWHGMTSWPAWGSVASPEGAVTERIMASSTVFALDADTGALRWRYDGKAVAHPAIVLGGECVFLADCSATPEEQEAARQERRQLIEKGVWEKDDITIDPKDTDVRRVIALDRATGQKQWERVIDLTGCGGDRLGMAYKDDVLCFFGCFSNHDRELFNSGKLKWRRITALSAKDGADRWSRPLNYLRRPVIMGDEILIEPRACNLYTGAIKERAHPLTGAPSTWEFVRPGHCCSITSASPHMFFLRGYFLWYYDVHRDQGMLPFGAIRPGCWINTIPANGLVLFPEASAGCTCSYPVNTTVALQPKKQQRVWALCVQRGEMTPVRHMAVNFGAPGDWRADDGTLWFSYPHPPSSTWYEYGINFQLGVEFLENQGYFCNNFEGIQVQGTDRPWLFASGCRGVKACTIPLLSGEQGPGVYTVRLYFVEANEIPRGRRVFTVALQGKPVLTKFDIMAEAGGPRIAVMKEFTGIKVQDTLRISFESKDKDPALDASPIINAIEIIREDAPVIASR